MNSNRVQRLNSLIREEVNLMLLKDFEFGDGVLLTITRVETVPNLSETKIYISTLPQKEIDRIFKILNKLVYAIQQKLNKRLRMRPVPKIRFIKEEKTGEAGRIEEILEKLKKEQNSDNI